MIERFVHIKDNEGNLKDICVRLPNGNLNIYVLQKLAEEGKIITDGEFSNIALELLSLYPIGPYPIVPQPERESPWLPTTRPEKKGRKHSNPSDELIEDLRMEMREGPQGG